MIKHIALITLLIMTAANLFAAEVDKETLIAITQITETQYKMIAVMTVKSTTTAGSTAKENVESLTYPRVIAEVNGAKVTENITDKNGDAVVSVSLNIVRTNDNITAHYELKHLDHKGTPAIRSGELRLD